MKNDTPATNIFANIVAVTTIAIWGTTFVWTKLLIREGITPAQIFTIRFIIAYILLTVVSLLKPQQHRWFSNNWKDEVIMVLLGLTGGSLYFLTENEALRFTTATNTSLIVCSCPLFASILIGMFYKTERLNSIQIIGTTLSLIGMAIVVLNGQFVLHLSPLGDILAFTACISWAIYSLFIKRIMNIYPATFITRKVFFYGIITILPYYFLQPGWPTMSQLIQPAVAINLIFLGAVASMLCFLTWNWCMKKLGAVHCTNYAYFNPVSTIICAVVVLSEPLTVYTIIGTLILISGLFLCNRKKIR